MIFYRIRELLRAGTGYGAAVIFFMIILSFPAAAEKALPGWKARAGLIAGVNPLSFGINAGLDRIIPLYPEKKGVLWDSARISPGVSILSNPSFSDTAFRLLVEPIALFNLTMEAGIRSYYTFAGMGFEPLEGYGSELSSVTGEDADGKNEIGSFIRLKPQIKFAVGPLLGTSAFSAAYYRFPDAEADYMAEPISITAVKTEDWVLTSTSQLLYSMGASGKRISFAAAGVEYNTVWVPEAPRDEWEGNHRVSAVGVLVFPLGEETELQSAAFLGSYVTGEPFKAYEPYFLTVVSIVKRL